MISNIIKRIEKEDQELEDIFKISHWSGDLEHFFDFILEYFEVDKVLEDKNDGKYDFPNGYLYYRQEHKSFNYIEYFLRQIKPFLLLAYKLTKVYKLPENLKENKINEDSIVNMVDNFIRLNRTGRPRKFYPKTQEEFKKFKKKYQNIIDFLREINSAKVKSLLDYANAIKKCKISKKQLNSYRFEFYYWKMNYKEWSRATLYRFDKDLIFLGSNYYWVKETLRKYDFYQKILEIKI